MNLCRETLAVLSRCRVATTVELAARLKVSEDKMRNALGTLATHGKISRRWVEGANLKHYAITDIGREALARPMRRHRLKAADIGRVNSVFQLGEQS